MNDTLKLPVGIDDFKKIREAGFYYVDKTKLIEQLLQSWGEVTLFTRAFLKLVQRNRFFRACIFRKKKNCVWNTWESILLFFYRLRE